MIRGVTFEPNMDTPNTSPVYGGFPRNVLQDHTSWQRLQFATFRTREWAAKSASILKARKINEIKWRNWAGRPRIRAERNARRAAQSLPALEARVEAASEMLDVVERTAALPGEQNGGGR